MSNAVNSEKPMTHEIEEIIADMGGADAVIAGMRESWETSMRMRDKHDALLEQYPDRWIAMSKDGALFVGDSLEEALSEVDAHGIDRSDVMIEFLDTNPAGLIL